MHGAKEHELQCAHPKSNIYLKNLKTEISLKSYLCFFLESGADVMSALKDREMRHEEEKKLFNCLVDLLSYEKITFNGEFMNFTRMIFKIFGFFLGDLPFK